MRCACPPTRESWGWGHAEGGSARALTSTSPRAGRFISVLTVSRSSCCVIGDVRRSRRVGLGQRARFAGACGSSDFVRATNRAAWVVCLLRPSNGACHMFKVERPSCRLGPPRSCVVRECLDGDDARSRGKHCLFTGVAGAVASKRLAPSSKSARATRVVGLRRPRIAFGVCGRDGLDCNFRGAVE